MATAVTMPRLGLTMAEGTVVEWHARPGEPVARGAVLLTVESEKAQVEVEAFEAGVLAAVYVEPGTTVPVGTLLGAIAAPGEPFDAAGFAAGFRPAVEDAAPGAAGEPVPRPPPVVADRALKAAPAARALARRLGVDLAAVRGTGPGGRITVADVEGAGAALAPAGCARLAYARTGAGPVLLLVAGYGVDASGWRPQVEGLRGEHTVITYDHRGVGASGPLGEGALELDVLADDAASLLAYLGTGPALVVGASMGAAVALELALRQPVAVRGLVLIAPVLEPDPRLTAVLRGWSEYEPPHADVRIRAMLPWLLGRETLAHAGRREAAAAALRAMAHRTPRETLRQHAEALVAWLGTRREALGRIAQPVLVVVGDDDVLTPPAQARAVAAALPRARLETATGAGHAVAIERVELVNRLIGEFDRAGV
jgi:pimeloyl-ACP methyl ester carboxylesterase